MLANTKARRDRRLDRRKVAIAAFAALFLFVATPAKAGIVEFVVHEPSSSMTVGFAVDVSEVFGLPKGSKVENAIPQVAGSDTAGLFGNLYVNLGTGTSVEFLGLGTVTVKSTDGGAGYAPFDPVVTDPSLPAGVTTPANFGLKTVAPDILNLLQVYHQLAGTFVSFAGAMPLAGTSFVMIPGDNFYLGTAGRLAFISALGNDTDSVAGDPLSILGDAIALVPNIGTWDPLDVAAGPLGTLTIPLTSAFEIPIVLDTGATVFIIFQAGGVLKATPRIPEPSSLVLLGFGVVGLVACGWRLRKRRRA